MDRYATQAMQNGFTIVRDRRSGLTGLYVTTTGAYRSGDLRNVPASLILSR
jgi:hypothetical protein